MDLNNLVASIGSAGPDAPFRLRQGVIQSVAANGTATVTIGGSTVQVANVKVASSVCPVPGATCFLATDGRDWFVLATLAPAGPAYGTMRKSTAQAIGTGAVTELTWGSRTDVIANGVTAGSNGWTIVVPGIYQVTFIGTFDINATGNRFAQIFKNSTAVANGVGTGPYGTQNGRLNATATLKLAIGDIVNGGLFQSSGANLNTDLNVTANILSVLWIGPSA